MTDPEKLAKATWHSWELGKSEAPGSTAAESQLRIRLEDAEDFILPDNPEALQGASTSTDTSTLSGEVLRDRSALGPTTVPASPNRTTPR